MSQVIIGIHGLGNKPPRERLEDWWKQSMYEGLKSINKHIRIPEFRLIYWADVMYNAPLDEDITDEEHPLYLDEKYLPAPKDYVPEKHEFRQKVMDIIQTQLERIFLNDDMTVNFSYITDRIIHKYFRELEVYYTVETPYNPNQMFSARQVIRQRVAEVLNEHRGDQIFLIGHSMGSIIAFDVLTYVVPEIKIDTFITIGSPLGMPVIMSKIALTSRMIYPAERKLSVPPGITRRWYNFSDIEDRVALINNLCRKFKANKHGVRARDFIVNNNYRINGISNPHKSFGYLRTPEFSRILYRFIKKEWLHPLQKLMNQFRSMPGKILSRNMNTF